MSITIAATFVQPPVRDVPESRDAGASLANELSTGFDFASVLLGLPDKAAPADGKNVDSEASPAPLAEPQFLATFALNFPNPSNPVCTTQERPADQTGLSSVGPLSPGRQDSLAQELRNHATGERPSPVPAAVSGEGKAANIAAPTMAMADALVRTEARTVELTVAPASSLATLAPANHTPAAGPLVPLSHEMPLALQTPLRDASWAGELGQKLQWFVSNEKQLARLTINPPQLGSVEITLKIDKDSANAHFVSANADVRAAIETALPRLREMFASTGVMLGQVSVGSESFQEPSDGQHDQSRRPRPAADKAILGMEGSGGVTGQATVAHRGSALIDIFA